MLSSCVQMRLVRMHNNPSCDALKDVPTCMLQLLSLCACTCCFGVRRRSNSERRDTAAWDTHKDNPAAASPSRWVPHKAACGTLRHVEVSAPV
jgi:hypothetical protein